MDAEQLALGDGDLHVAVLLGRAQPNVLDHRAERAQDRQRFLERGHDLGIGADVVLVEMADDADAHPVQAVTQPRGVIGNGPVGARRVLRIVAGDGLQQDRDVGHGPGHRADMVEGEGVGIHAAPAHQAVGRLQPGNPAQRRRQPDGAAGVRTECRRGEPCGHCSAGAAGRAAGEVPGVPRVARRRPRQVERGAAMRELVRRELAQQYPAALVQLGNGRGVFQRHRFGADAGLAGGANARGGEDVLQRERNAVQLAAIVAGRDLRLRCPRLLQRALRRDQEVGVQLRIQRARPVQQGPGQVDGRELATLDHGRRLRHGQRVELRRSGAQVVGHAAGGCVMNGSSYASGSIASLIVPSPSQPGSGSCPPLPL